MPVIRELLVGLGVKVDQKAVDRFAKSITSVKRQMLLAGAAAGAAAAGIFAIAKATAAAGDEAAKQSKRVGISADTYQELGYAAKLSGTSIEEVGVGIRRLALTMDAARKGSKEQAQLFRSLGIAVTDSEGKLRDADVIFESVAERMAGMRDGLEKTALAQRIFGRSGNAMINLLNSGADGIRRMREEARALGFVLDEDARKKAELFNDQMLRLKTAAIGIRNTIGVELIPVINDAAEEIIVWWKANQKVVRTQVREWTLRLVASLKDLGRWLRDVYDRLAPLIERAGGFAEVLRGLVKVLLLWQAAKFVVTLYQMVAALRAMGVAGALAAGKLALIALIVAGAALAFEDLAVFVRGGDSALGRFVAAHRGSGGVIGGITVALIEMREALGGAADAERAGARIYRTDAEQLDALTLPIIKHLDDFFTWLFGLPGRAFSAVWDVLTVFWRANLAFFDRISSAIISGVGGTIDWALGRINDLLAAAARLNMALGGVFSGNVAPGALFGSATPQAQAGRASNAAANAGGASNRPSINAGGISVMVNAPSPGATPQEISRAAQTGVENGLQSLLRSASANASGREL